MMSEITFCIIKTYDGYNMWLTCSVTTQMCCRVFQLKPLWSEQNVKPF